jgi:hypothetical protein
MTRTAKLSQAVMLESFHQKMRGPSPREMMRRPKRAARAITQAREEGLG